MPKQTKLDPPHVILKKILEEFLKWSYTTRRDKQREYQANIRTLFNNSGKNDLKLQRRLMSMILNGAVLSDEEILRLIKIIYLTNFGD